VCVCKYTCAPDLSWECVRATDSASSSDPLILNTAHPSLTPQHDQDTRFPVYFGHFFPLDTLFLLFMLNKSLSEAWRHTHCVCRLLFQPQYIYTYTYTYTYIYKKVRMYIYIYIYIYTHTHIYIYRERERERENTTLTFYFIYIYAFSRRLYPKRLTVHSGYTFVLSVCVFPGNRTHNLCAANAMLQPLSHRNTMFMLKHLSRAVE